MSDFIVGATPAFFMDGNHLPFTVSGIEGVISLFETGKNGRQIAIVGDIAVMYLDTVTFLPVIDCLRENLAASAYPESIYIAILILPSFLEIDMYYCIVGLAGSSTIAA